MSNVWFTSDIHLSHEKLLGFRSEVHNKLIPTTEYHDEWLISKWNEQVKKRDTVWVLGDVAFHPSALEKLTRMNGLKKLIMGNHDKYPMQDYMRYFHEVRGVWKKYKFVMSHVPIHPNEFNDRWKFNVHGHIHHDEKDIGDERYFNVNWDIQKRLVSLDEVLTIINLRGVEL